MTSLHAPGTRPQGRTRRNSPASGRRCPCCGQLRPPALSVTPGFGSIRLAGELHFFPRAMARRLARLFAGERLTPAAVAPLSEHPAFGRLAERGSDMRFGLARRVADLAS